LAIKFRQKLRPARPRVPRDAFVGDEWPCAGDAAWARPARGPMESARTSRPPLNPCAGGRRRGAFLVSPRPEPLRNCPAMDAPLKTRRPALLTAYPEPRSVKNPSPPRKRRGFPAHPLPMPFGPARVRPAFSRRRFRRRTPVSDRAAPNPLCRWRRRRHTKRIAQGSRFLGKILLRIR